MAQQTRESGDGALAPVYGIQKVAKPINKNNKINPQTHTSLWIVFFLKKRIAQSIDYLWDFTLCFTGLPPKNVASRGPNRAESLFETIEAIIWKPKIASVLLGLYYQDRLKGACRVKLYFSYYFIVSRY